MCLVKTWHSFTTAYSKAYSRTVMQRHLQELSRPLFRRTRTRLQVDVYNRLGRQLAVAIAKEDSSEVISTLQEMKDSSIRESRLNSLIQEIRSTTDLLDDVYTCDNCGAFCHSDDCYSVSDGDSTVCSSCFDDHYATCERRRCHEVVHIDSLCEVDDEQWCEHCRDNYAYHWESDDSWHSEPESCPPDCEDFYPSQRESEIWQKLRQLHIDSRDKTLRYEFPNNGISEVGESELADYLASLIPDDSTDRLSAIAQLFADDKGDAELLQWTKGRGTLPKRLSREFARRFNVKLSSAQLSQIGNIGSKHCCKKITLHVALHTGHIYWGESDFGQTPSGSCWWGGYAGARYQWEAMHNAFCFQIFSDETGPLQADRIRNGIGRCWVFVRDGIIVMYNQYLNGYVSDVFGTADLKLGMARTLSQILGLNYVACKVKNSYSGFYINGEGQSTNNGYVLGINPPQELPTVFDLKMSAPDCDES